MQQGVRQHWEDPGCSRQQNNMLASTSNGGGHNSQEISHEMPPQRQPGLLPGGVRSQDDATVGYFFQRPQTEQYNSKRWAVGDDSAIATVC